MKVNSISVRNVVTKTVSQIAVSYVGGTTKNFFSRHRRVFWVGPYSPVYDYLGMSGVRRQFTDLCEFTKSCAVVFYQDSIIKRNIDDAKWQEPNHV